MVVTTFALSAILLLQHTRHGWPFSLHMVQPPAAGARSGELAAARGQQTGAERVPVDVDASKIDQLGIGFETVQGETLAQPLRAVATVVPDESRISHAHTRVAGWVEELLVNTTGQSVRAGEPLARIFSQELLSSQTEYLAARRQAAAGLTSVVVNSGRARLKVFGMTEAEIAEIERTGEPMRLVTVVAPQSGIVVHRGISVGTAVNPSTEIITVADLSTVWVIAEVPESDVPAIRIGMPATLEFSGSGGPAVTSLVAFINPDLDGADADRAGAVRGAKSWGRSEAGALRNGRVPSCGPACSDRVA